MTDTDYSRPSFRDALALELANCDNVELRDKLTFKLRVAELLADNPRICEFGCNTIERNRDRFDRTQPYVPKTRTFTINDRQIERLRKMCAFINENLPVAENTRGRKLIGSYGFKHVLEKQNWTEDTDRYVSNGEGMVAMILCGHKPRWPKDKSDPNCVFSVMKIRYLTLVEEAERRQ